MKWPARLSLAWLAVSALHAQPQLFSHGIVNAASSMAASLPSGAIARGSTFSVYGRRIGPAASPSLAFPLGTSLGGVSITVTQGTTVVNAIPVFVSAGQVNAIMPSTAPLGLVSLQLRVNGSLTNPLPVKVVNSSFGIFTATGAGLGPAIAQNFVSQTSQPINALQIPATPGQVITLWGTGLGPVSYSDGLQPTVASLPTRTEVFVGGIPAQIAYNGRSPCCSGIDQIVFTVPPNAPLGCWVPIFVRTEGVIVSNSTTMAISADGSPCAEPSNALSSALIGGGGIASLVLARFNLRQDFGVRTPGDFLTDLTGAFLGVEQKAPFNFNPMFSLPPVGTCTTYTTAGSFMADTPELPLSAPTVRVLDAGTLTAAGVKSTQNFFATPTADQQQSFLGGSATALPSIPSTAQLDSPVQVAASGGKDVGAFNAKGAAPASPLNWTNRDQLRFVDRTQALTFSWTGGDSTSPVFAAGGAVDIPNNATSLFLCLAPPGSTSFTVPAAILANIPASAARLKFSLAAIYLGQWNINAPTAFSATGLDKGILSVAGVSGREVIFK